VHWRSTARLDKVMVRREEQPWQARATLLLDTLSSGHGGEGPASSFEWAVAAAASIGVHLVRSGYHLRLVTDTGATIEGSNLGVDGGSSDVEGALLDALAVANAQDVLDALPEGLDAEVDERGRFTLDDLHPGPLSLTCRRDGAAAVSTSWVDIG